MKPETDLSITFQSCGKTIDERPRPDRIAEPVKTLWTRGSLTVLTVVPHEGPWNGLPQTLSFPCSPFVGGVGGAALPSCCSDVAFGSLVAPPQAAVRSATTVVVTTRFRMEHPR